MLARCYEFIKSNTIGDTWEMLTWQKQFVTRILYPRSLESGIAIATMGPRWFPYSPTIVVVSGPACNILQVTNYGDLHPENQDPQARSFLQKAIRHVTGLDHDLQIERFFLKKHIANVDANTLLTISDAFLQNWNHDESLQNNMTLFASRIIGSCLFGIPVISMVDVKILRRFESLLIQGDFYSKDFLNAKKDFHDLCHRLIANGAEEIYQAQKTIYDLLENQHLKADNTDELVENIKKVGGASGIFPAGNLGALLAVAIGLIAENDEVRNKLCEELKNADANELTDLPYLHCIYLECCRMASPAAFAIRSTSKEAELKIKAKDESVKIYKIPNHAMLFAPLRCVNNEKSFWENPTVFNPDRFLHKDKYRQGIIGDYFVPFSIGTRMCPASVKLIPLAFKVFIATLFSQYEVRLDKKIEVIPITSLDSRWKHEYYAKLTH